MKILLDESVPRLLKLRLPHWDILRKHPYIKREWCDQALRQPAHREVQPDGRIRHWILIPELGRYLRVVTLADSMTVHNAFPDRNFKEMKS